MSAFNEGDVVIVGTGQAGTIHHIGNDVWVLLANTIVWYGSIGQIRHPQSPEDLAACPLDVDRFIGR